MKLHFYGGAKVVTGANYLLETEKNQIMVDCGLFQGSQELHELNYQALPYDPQKVDFVFITHSHLDHCGRLAKLVKDGFNGPIICTPPTRDLMGVALEDAVHIMAEEADEKGIEPLYTQADYNKMMNQITAYEYDETIKLNEQLSFCLREAGHILGSSIIELYVQENNKKTKIVFTGDLGNPPTPLLKPPAQIDSADYLIIESAYGDRLHESKTERKNLLLETILQAIARKAVLLIPSFALERTQELLYELNDFAESKKIPKIPIFIDSPLAIKVTEVYKKSQKYFNKKTRYVIASGDDIFDFPGLKFTLSKQESKDIILFKPPKIIIAGAGMSTGGRILFHEKEYLSNANNILLFVGFQVEGTLGRQILNGAPIVNILGARIKNKAQIKAIGGYSAHADQKQLLNFVKQIKSPLKNIFIVQGEKKPAESLQKIIINKLGQPAMVPNYEDEVTL